MNGNELSPDEKAFVRGNFKAIRESLTPYFNDRGVVFSNPQIFTFLSFSPAALAIASDGQVDDMERASLKQIAKTMNVDNMVNLELMEVLAFAPEPENCITNEKFNEKAEEELLYLSENMEKYKEDFMDALKKFLQFDRNPEHETSMTNSFVTLMNSIIENNTSENKEEELAKMADLQKELGINVA